MMRKILVSLLLLVSGYAMAQPANYVPYASRNRYIALMADSTFHIPRFNGAPSLRTGGSTNDGALAADTANNRLYIYNGGSWTVVNKDTSNTFLNSLYKKSGTDSVFQIKGGTHTFAFTVGGGGSGDGIASLGTSAYGLITQNDSTYKVDTIQLSTRLWRQKGIDSVQGNVNLKLNITDTANIKPRLYAGSNITITGTYPNLTIAASGGGGGTNNANIGSGYRWLNPGTQEVRTFFAGLYTTIDSSSNTNGLTVKVDTASLFPALRATIPSGGGSASPAGNYGNVQLNRNGALATPASDSLDFDAGLNIKGALSATALPTGGVDADSVVVINSSGAFKKRNVSAFARMNTTSAANQLALFNGNGTIYSSSKFNFSDATYPTMSIIGSDPLIYIGPSATLTNNPSFGSGAGAAIYGGATYKSVQLVDQISGGIQMARFYNSSGTIYNNLNGLVISNSLSSPSNYQGNYTIQKTVPYANNLNYHGFTDQTVFNAQSTAFNSFGSFVTFGNNRFTQDHYAAFQAVWYKDSSNQMSKVYDFASAVSEHREGTIDSLFRFKVWPVTVTGGATLNVEYGIYMPTGSATTKYGAYIEDNVGLGTTAPTAKLDINSDKFRVRTSKTPSSASDTGNAGDICWDANYIYICTATNTWKRVAIATW